MIQAATAIVRLLRRYNNDPDAKAAFRARYHQHVMGWDEFCYDITAGDARRLGERVDGPALGTIAVVGRVVATGKSRNGSSLEVSIGSDEPSLRLAICSRPAVSMAHVAVDDVVLGYGRWSSWRKDGDSPLWVKLWAENSSQVAVVERP